MNSGSNKIFIVYKHTNKTTGLSYIGLTSQSISNRLNGHIQQSKRGCGWKFHEAIRTYGINDFESMVLCECNSLDEAKEKEKFYIEQFDSYRAGYNSNKGGWGGYDKTEEIIRKQSETLKKSYREKKISSPFSDPDIHKKTIESRSLNGTNIWITNNPMKNKEQAMSIAAKRSGVNHYTFGKHHYIVYDSNEVKTEFTNCCLRQLLDFYSMPASTYHKYVNTNSSPSRGAFKRFRIYCENIEN